MARVVGWEALGGEGPTHFLLEGGDHGACVFVWVVDFEPC